MLSIFHLFFVLVEQEKRNYFSRPASAYTRIGNALSGLCKI